MAEDNMSDYFDKEGEDYEENAWSELDWQRFLKRNEQKVREFVALYNHASTPAFKEVHRWIAWDAAQEANPEVSLPWAQVFQVSAESFQDHPLLIITQGLLGDVRQRWRAFAALNEEQLPITFVFEFEDALRAAAEKAMLAIVGLELAEDPMAICYAKHTLQAFNNALGVLYCLPECLFRKEALQRVFDLRELWIRFIEECRAE